MPRLIGLLLAGLAGCSFPVGTHSLCGRTAPEAEALAGARLAPRIEAGYGGRVGDADAQSRLNRLAERLAIASPELAGSYSCYLLASERLNAVSAPGGRIYLTSGLYKRLTGDAEVAAVLAHEMAHLSSRDCFKPRCRSSEESLQREVQADTLAVGYLLAGGYDPAALTGIFRLIEREQPSGWSQIRADNITARLPATQGSRNTSANQLRR